MIIELKHMKGHGKPKEWLEEIDNDPSWGCGVKADGFREWFIINKHTNRLVSSAGNNHEDMVPHLRDLLLPAFCATVLDCEAYSPTKDFNDTKSIFGAYPERAIAWQKENGKAKLLVFDCVMYKGKSIAELELKYRREYAAEIVARMVSMGSKHIFLENLVFKNKRDYFDKVVSDGEEGLMCKRMSGIYTMGGRTKDWIKVKRMRTWDAVIAGFTDGKGKYSDVIGAIEYGFYKDGEIVKAGRCSGMTDDDRKEFASNRKSYIGRVIEIEGQQMSDDGAIRFPRFHRFRNDKKMKECTLEEALKS